VATSKQCYTVALIGSESAKTLSVLQFQEPCVAGSDSARVRLLGTKSGVSVTGVPPAMLNKLGAFANVAAGPSVVFTSSEGKSLTAAIVAGRSYTLAVAPDGSLRLTDFGDGRSTQAIAGGSALLSVIDGVASLSTAPVALIDNGGAARIAAASAKSGAVDRTVKFWLSTGLRANTEYVASVRGPQGEVGPTARFKTPGTMTQKVTFGASSCMGPDGRPWRTLSHAAGAKLDFALLLGDAVYADGAVTQSEFRAVWADALPVQGYKDLFRSTSVVVTNDDHELDDDWTLDNKNRSVITASYRAYKEAMPLFVGGTAEQGAAAHADDNARLYRYISYGAVDVFVLDARSFRSPKAGTYLGAAQMTWLKAALLRSKAPFKFIANSIPIADWGSLLGPIEEDNRWTFKSYEAERTSILSYIDSNAIPGVVWLTGDFHVGSVVRVGSNSRSLAYEAFEVMAGPGGSEINPFFRWKLHFLGKLWDVVARQFIKIIAKYSYIKLTCNPLTKRVFIDFIGDDGRSIWNTELDVSGAKTKIVGNGWSFLRIDGEDEDDGSTDTTAISAASIIATCALLLATPFLFLL
jgi:hypothetical protein